MAFLPLRAYVPACGVSLTCAGGQRKGIAAATIEIDSQEPSLRRSTSIVVWVVIFAVLAVIAHIMQQPPRAPGEPVTGYARVVDGDSLEIAGVRVRLNGIDAPERDQDCRDGDGRTYSCGRAAMRALTDAIAGRSVTCTPVQVDRYDRDVARCTVDDADRGEADLAEIMVRGGHALDYARHSRGRYAAAEREARDARRGLWAGSFEAPAAWRQQHTTR
jgi:endonuclease YncB( thermonuclease family)